jgi:hypothetical protein
LFLPGTDIVHRITVAEIESPLAVLDSLPPGRLPPVYWSPSKTDTIGVRLTDSLDVVADSTSDWSVFAAWAHHGTWRINTSGTGAGTSAAVAEFPMLVRLTAAEFDFGEAAVDGRDIRFSDPDGSELHFQVERWDAAAGLAEIWVRIPKVDGASERDAFLMHWGNAEAESHSSGPTVFSPANAFAAVLHLDEKGNSRDGGYADATGSGRSGTGIALADSGAGEGAVGPGQTLDGVRQWIRVEGNFPEGNAPRSLSVWGKAINPAARSYLAVYGSANDLATYGAWDNFGKWMVWHWGNGNDLESSAAVDSGWHQVTLDYDGVTSRIYLDGALAGSAEENLATTPTGFVIGNEPAGGYPWQGDVDEVEVSAVSRSVDWIKLSFASQRPGAKILRLEIGD